MGIKKNITYNVILTLSQYIIGFITFPYISRVLGVSNIGIVSFVDNTINYFILFSTLGAATIGTREIAKYQNDREKINIVFSSLITIYTIYTCIVVIVYVFAISFVEQLRIHQQLFYIGIAKLIFSVFLIEWFYRGTENFKYITTRTLMIKILYVITLLIFVKNNSHYKIYFILTTSVVVVNAFINIIYSRKFVRLSIKGITLKPYFKQSFYLGSYSLLTSMYTTFNVMYLGFVSNTVEVGYYWAALTLYGILLGFFSAFTGAMMPRMSSLLFFGEKEAFKNLIQKSFNLVFTISFPLIFGSILLAPQIIGLLAGKGYEGAIFPMRIIMPLVLIVGIAQILAIQVILPMQKDKLILYGSLLGAFIGLTFNIVLVKKFGSEGTAFVLLLSECAVTMFYIYTVRKNNLIGFPWQSLVNNFIYSLPIILICFSFLRIFKGNNLLILLFSVGISILYFLIVNLYVVKNAALIEIKKSLQSKLQ